MIRIIIILAFIQSCRIRVVRCVWFLEQPVCTLGKFCRVFAVRCPIFICMCPVLSCALTNLSTLNLHIRIELHNTILTATIDGAFYKGIISDSHIGTTGQSQSLNKPDIFVQVCKIFPNIFVGVCMCRINPLPFTTCLADSCMDVRVIEHHTSGRALCKSIRTSRQDSLTGAKDVTGIIWTALFSHLHSCFRSNFGIALYDYGTRAAVGVFQCIRHA